MREFTYENFIKSYGWEICIFKVKSSFDGLNKLKDKLKELEDSKEVGFGFFSQVIHE